MLRPTLKSLPKPNAKYRATSNAYKSSYFLNCYFNDVASLETVAVKLEGVNMWKGIIAHGDERLSANDLVEIGRTLENT